VVRTQGQKPINRNRLTMSRTKEYKYRVLVYPNITKKYDEILKDSYIVLLPSVIKAISKINDSVHFTILNPIHLFELDEMKNVKQLIYNQKFSANNNQMRTSFFFDGGVFMDVLNYEENDFDLVYSHLPEHTLQISNLLQNQTHSVPKVFGYCHWFDFKNASAKNMSLQNFIGILEMEVCGVNSMYLKDIVMKEAKKYFNTDVLTKLDEIIQPHHLGVESVDFKEPTYPKIKKIAFNHRGQSYMGFNWFVSSMEKLWKIRKDFKVITFQKDADCSKYEWTDYQKPLSLPREDYFKELQSCYIGVGCFDGSKGSGGASWSIGVTDGLSLGVPYILPNKYVWPQLMGDDYPLLYNHKDEGSFITMISNVMDDKKLYNSARKKFEPILKKMIWPKQVKSWLDWDSLLDANTFPMVGGDTKTYNDVLNIIKKRKRVSKKQLIGELNWGKQFKFGRYRNRLRLESNIRFTTDGYEWVN
jgi:hypothetical protein